MNSTSHQHHRLINTFIGLTIIGFVSSLPLVVFAESQIPSNKNRQHVHKERQHVHKQIQITLPKAKADTYATGPQQQVKQNRQK